MILLNKGFVGPLKKIFFNLKISIKFQKKNFPLTIVICGGQTTSG